LDAAAAAAAAAAVAAGGGAGGAAPTPVATPSPAAAAGGAASGAPRDFKIKVDLLTDRAIVAMQRITRTTPGWNVPVLRRGLLRRGLSGASLSRSSMRSLVRAASRADASWRSMRGQSARNFSPGAGQSWHALGAFPASPTASGYGSRLVNRRPSPPGATSGAAAGGAEPQRDVLADAVGLATGRTASTAAGGGGTRRISATAADGSAAQPAGPSGAAAATAGDALRRDAPAGAAPKLELRTGSLRFHLSQLDVMAVEDDADGDVDEPDEDDVFDAELPDPEFSPEDVATFDTALCDAMVDEFFGEFNDGVVAYIKGDWPTARAHLRAVLDLRPSDGPTRTLLRVMDEACVGGAGSDGPAPASWRGFRELTEK
jgi:hypothetical protein